jgi:hypothetical protein
MTVFDVLQHQHGKKKPIPASNITCPCKNNTSFTFLDITKQRIRQKRNRDREKKTYLGEQIPDQ